MVSSLREDNCRVDMAYYSSCWHQVGQSVACDREGEVGVWMG